MLDGKVALVTGASRGIGAGTAVVLARHGADVVVNYHRSPQQAEEVCERIRALGRRALPVRADVTDGDAVRRMVGEIERTLGPVDILVNNAGYNPIRGIMEIDEADWDRVLDLNLKTYFRCTRAVLPAMLERADGRIVNVTSISGQRGGFSCDVDYSAAKAGIIGFTRALARWAGPRGILVNAVAPGYIETSMHAGPLTPLLARLVDSVPLKRQGTPAEVGEVIAFLAGPGASYIVGEVISVNGGAHIG